MQSSEVFTEIKGKLGDENFAEWIKAPMILEAVLGKQAM